MRDSFIFYRSYFETISELSPKEQLKLFTAIANFALNDIEPDGLPKTAGIIFTAIKPFLGTKKNNGKKPVSKLELIELPNAEYTKLTQEQYDTLVDKYGKLLADEAIGLFDSWLARGGKAAKNYMSNDSHYNHFRSDSWTINEAKKKLNEKEAASMPNWSV